MTHGERENSDRGRRQNICELLRLYLAKEGYETVIANDGEAAVAAFEKEKPNMVLLDVMMPKMDGWEVCRRIRAADNTPVDVYKRQENIPCGQRRCVRRRCPSLWRRQKYSSTVPWTV